MERDISLEQYLERLARFSGDADGKRIRSRFRDHRGSSELAMLACPSREELEQLQKAVAIMTPAERQLAARLSDEQIQRIAADAETDPAILAIFINGYVLHCKRGV